MPSRIGASLVVAVLLAACASEVRREPVEIAATAPEASYIGAPLTKR